MGADQRNLDVFRVIRLTDLWGREGRGAEKEVADGLE